MARFREEHFYCIVLIFVAFAEGLLAIPMLIPLFDGGAAEIYLVVGLVHIVLLLLLFTRMVDIRPYLLHIAGGLGLFLSIIPYVNFIYHGFVCILALRAIRRYIRYFKSYLKADVDEELEG